VNLALIDFPNIFRICVHLRNVRDNWDLCAYLAFEQVRRFLGYLPIVDKTHPWEVVLALDDARGGYWRGDIYPLYKADRAKRRAKDDIDWDSVFQAMDGLLDDIRCHLPWKVIRAPRCEADDVIGVLARQTENLAVILSADSDFLQLASDQVLVYSPMTHEFAEFPGAHRVAGAGVHCETPADYLQYCILTGQGRKDNVPNVKTPSDWPEDKRRPGFGPVAAAAVLGDLDGWLERNGLKENYERNRALIDLSRIPETYVQRIEEAYRTAVLPEPDMQGFLRVRGWRPLALEPDEPLEDADLSGVEFEL
jgi:5'-3' exonuclease